MRQTILMNCGYKRTGKDTLKDILDGNNVNKYKFFVYGTHEKNMVDIRKQYTKLSFAEPLKSEVHRIFNIPFEINDVNKDIKMFKLPNEQIVSARDLYQIWGEHKKTHDMNHWAKLLKNKIKDENYYISDWRFINEYVFMKNIDADIITTRIFRNSVKIPKYENKSEHELDNFTTDFLIVSDELDFQAAIRVFPQYSNYTYKYTIE